MKVHSLIVSVPIHEFNVFHLKRVVIQWSLMVLPRDTEQIKEILNLIFSIIFFIEVSVIIEECHVYWFWKFKNTVSSTVNFFDPKTYWCFPILHIDLFSTNFDYAEILSFDTIRVFLFNDNRELEFSTLVCIVKWYIECDVLGGIDIFEEIWVFFFLTIFVIDINLRFIVFIWIRCKRELVPISLVNFQLPICLRRLNKFRIGIRKNFNCDFEFYECVFNGNIRVPIS